MLMLLFFFNYWILMGIFIMLGVVLAPAWPMIVGIGTSSYRERSGTVASVLSASSGLGGAVIPVLIGWVSEKAGFYGGFWLLVAASAIGFFIIWLNKGVYAKT
jgi:fucose permease